MTVKIQLRRGTASNWTSTNPTLSAGEIGVETDTNKFKIGNGSSGWTSLSYAATLPSEVLSLSGGTLTGALTLHANPSNSFHAATKQYVDAVSEGLHIHASVVAATTADINISTDLENGDVLDGVTLATGNRVLVKNQTNAAQNGIYVVQSSGAAVRAADFDSPSEIDGGDFVFVTGGTTNDNTGWTQVNTVGTIGTDPIQFTQFSGAGTYTAGNGLSLNGTVFSVDTSIVAGVSTTQTLSNKTINESNNTIVVGEGTISKASSGVGYMGMPQNSRSSSYTLSALDAGKHIYVTQSGQTLTIPSNSTTALPIGTTIVVVSANGVSTTIAIDSDTLRLANSSSTGSRTLASNGFATLLKINTTEWIASGNGLS